uniref:hypothetical protein n=1 Tax=Phocaeicola paurosaccharolyticus TaxID=732242 RepID=UPI002FE2EF21
YEQIRHVLLFSVCSYMVGLLVSRGWENMTYEELEEYLKCREQEERQAAIMWSTGSFQGVAVR